MNVSEELIRSIVEKVLSETAAASSCGCGFEKHVDPSGVLSVKTSTVKLEPFEGRNDVKLKDVATLEEMPETSSTSPRVAISISAPPITPNTPIPCSLPTGSKEAGPPSHPPAAHWAAGGCCLSDFSFSP